MAACLLIGVSAASGDAQTTFTLNLSYSGSASLDVTETNPNDNTYSFTETASFSWRVNVADTYEGTNGAYGLTNQTGTVVGSGSVNAVYNDFGNSTTELSCQFGAPSPPPSGMQWQNIALAYPDLHGGYYGGVYLNDFNWVENCAQGYPSYPPSYMEAGAAPANSCWTVADDPQWDASVDQLASVDGPNGGTQNYAADDTGSFSPCNDTGTVTRKLNATLTLSQSGATVPAPSSPEYTALQAVKNAAKQDMRTRTIPNAMRYCVPFTANATALGAGVLLLSAGPTIGGALAVSGGLTTAALAPFCQATVVAAYRDYRIYKDPPLKSINVLARPAAVSGVKLPGCKSHHGKLRVFCKRLRAALEKLVVDARRVASISTAAEQSLSRAHAAELRGDSAAFSAQDADLTTLEAQLGPAEAAERSAGKHLASVYASVHIRFRLTKRASRKAIKHAEALAAKDGVTVSDLESVDSSALKPQAANLLADLREL